MMLDFLDAQEYFTCAAFAGHIVGVAFRAGH